MLQRVLFSFLLWSSFLSFYPLSAQAEESLLRQKKVVAQTTWSESCGLKVSFAPLNNGSFPRSGWIHDVDPQSSVYKDLIDDIKSNKRQENRYELILDYQVFGKSKNSVIYKKFGEVIKLHSFRLLD